jgi:ribosomal-protein-alanine N-acetyltransferase
MDETTDKQRMECHVRWMIRRDMPEVLAIETESFEFPWLEEDFLRYLRARNSVGIVAEHDDRVTGFMVYELCKTQIHVPNFAVAQDFRRRSVGTQMVNKLISKLSTQHRTRITLKIRETNLVANEFFTSLGFRVLFLLKNHYCDSQNAYSMQYTL